MTAPLTNVYTVSSLKNGPLPSNPHLVTLSTDEVSSTTIYADVIQVLWQSTDSQVVRLMQQTAAQTSTSSAIPASKTASIAAATSSTSTPTVTTNPSGGMTTGTKVGLGIGIPVACIILAALAFGLLTLIRRRRRTGPAPAHEIPRQKNNEYRLHELDPDFIGQSAPVEMEARDVTELPATKMAPELDSRTPSGKSKKGRYSRVGKDDVDETPEEKS